MSDWEKASTVRVMPPARPRKLAKVPFVELADGRQAQPAQALSQLARTGSPGGSVALLAAHPATGDALASLLGCDEPWQQAPGPALATRYPDTAVALGELLASLR